MTTVVCDLCDDTFLVDLQSRIDKRNMPHPQETRWSDNLRKVAGKSWMRIAGEVKWRLERPNVQQGTANK